MGVFWHFTVDIPKTLRCNFLWEELPTAPHLPNVFVHIKNGYEHLKNSYHGKSKILKNVVIVAFLSTYPHMFFPARSGAAAAKHGQEQGLEPSRAAEAALRAAGVLWMIRWLAKKLDGFHGKMFYPKW